MTDLVTPVAESTPSKSERGTLYRMPVGFGPALGPRQGPDGRDFTGLEHRCTHFSLRFDVAPERLSAVMPPGFRPAEKPAVTFQLNFNEDVAWLAGRGYNYLEVLMSTVYEGERDTVEGDLVAVMWESLADAVWPGREEIGLPKLYADIPAPQVTSAGTSVLASWDGFGFFDASFDGLRLGPWDEEAVARAEPSVRGTGGSETGRPRLYYKYIPRTGGEGEADVAYATMTPAGANQVRVVESWSGAGAAAFRPARWEDLPTFAQIVNGMAGLELGDPVEARMTRLIVTFNDLRDQRVLT